jgi:amino acid transporter
MYGDVETAEQYGYVARGLKSRHIQFIALGGTIGTGLFLGIGKALATSGPLSILLGYSITGLAVFSLMQSLGEMSTWLPLPGAIPQFASRFVDESMGFAVGWNQWYNCAITLCVEISAAGLVIEYWTTKVNQGVWIAIILVLVLALNIFAVAIYGEAEFLFASLKIITIVGLLLLAFILFWGGGPTHDRLGFRYWKHNAMRYYIGSSNTGRFLGLWATLVQASFSYSGVENVAVAAGESENPRKNIPKAVRRVFWRILFFYVLGSLAVGVLVSADDDRLLGNGPGAARSPWVIAMYRAQIPVLPDIVNAVILSSASSSANAFLYTGSRYMFALAQNRQAPRFFLRCTKNGVPWIAVLTTWAVGLITFMTVTSGGNNVFNWFANLTTIATLFTWCTICISYIQFYKALAYHNISRDTLVFRSHFQPYNAWIGLVFFSLIILFNGFAVFTNGMWNVSDFIVAYIGIPIFFGLYIFWKIFKRTKWWQPADMDIFTGKAEIDAEEAAWIDPVPKNVFEKIWFWIA